MNENFAKSFSKFFAKIELFTLPFVCKTVKQMNQIVGNDIISTPALSIGSVAHREV
jgi:hypothetical protein